MAYKIYIMEIQKNKKSGISINAISPLILLVSVILVSFCRQSEPVLVGFIADLSSRNAGLGIQGVLEDYSIDQFGDGIREHSYYVVKNNTYELFYQY